MIANGTTCDSGLSGNTQKIDLVITIDGPAGSGKTTVSKVIADRLNYSYIDTGALYRGIAYEASIAGIAPDDDTGLEALCGDLVLDLKQESKGLRLYSYDKDISEAIRTPAITMLASAVSARRPVRNYLLEIQRAFGRSGRVVMEGRDMGTVVFPQADVKFFLVATLEARARRRFTQMSARSNQTLNQVEQDMHRRDSDDSNRNLAPLKPAEDAILIDSTALCLEAVIDTMLGHIRSVLDSAVTD